MSENGLKLVMVEREVCGDFNGGKNKHLFDVFIGHGERLGPLKDEVDQAHVVVGVKVGQVDRFQVP